MQQGVQQQRSTRRVNTSQRVNPVSTPGSGGSRQSNESDGVDSGSASVSKTQGDEKFHQSDSVYYL